jgi:hypothetical protein
MTLRRTVAVVLGTSLLIFHLGGPLQGEPSDATEVDRLIQRLGNDREQAAEVRRAVFGIAEGSVWLWDVGTWNVLRRYSALAPCRWFLATLGLAKRATDQVLSRAASAQLAGRSSKFRHR